MKLILLQDVANLGSKGDVVTVKDGYGRNFLIPTSQAVIANRSNIAMNDEMMRQSARRREGNRKASLEIAEQLATVSFTIGVKAGEDDRIFGTVTTQQIADQLHAKGFNIDRKKIHIPSEIKALGEYKAVITLMADIKPEVAFTVVKAES
jgi:large subunit ribosomal protein L9